MNGPTLFDLSSVFSTVASAVPDQEILVWRERRLTYTEVDRCIDAFAAYLRIAGQSDAHEEFIAAIRDWAATQRGDASRSGETDLSTTLTRTGRDGSAQQDTP